MDKKERLDLYDKCKETWGLYPQYDQCTEEMAELMVAMNKMKRKYIHGEYKGEEKIDYNFVEELADVSICIEQLKYWAGEEKVNEIFQQKLSRLQHRLNK